MEAGKIHQARKRLAELSEHFGTVWIGQAARERLERMDAGSGAEEETTKEEEK